MKKSEIENRNYDLIREWVRITPDVKAPEGLTHNVMTRIAMEPAVYAIQNRSSFGLPFRIVVGGSFIILLVLSLLTPRIDTSIINGFLGRVPKLDSLIPGFNLADLPLVTLSRYFLYIIPGIFLLLLIDYIFQRYLPGRK